VAEHGAQLKAHEAQHEKHSAEFDKVWLQIETTRKSSEQRHVEIRELTVTVGGMAVRLAGLDDFIRGDMRKAVIGLVVALVVLAALVVLTLTGDVQSVHDAAQSAIPGNTP
jgi:hypothetical protein